MTKGKGTILVVDDEFAIAETLKELIEDEGYRVVLAANGEEALERVKAEAPDLVITDVMMPGISGLEMVRILRTQDEYPKMPIIVMSSAPRTAAIKAQQDNQYVSYFFRKPFDLGQLLAAIEKLLTP